MSVLRIRIYGDPVLREKCAPIAEIDGDVRRLATDMVETLRNADGVGLAGPQVGETRRLIVVHPPAGAGSERGEPRVLVNPEVLEQAGAEVSAEEGCLSLPGIYDAVKRRERVRIRAQDLDGGEVSLEADGMLSRILLHEIDHLDGVLFIDRIGPMRRALLRRRLRELQE
jgi:peptide deformylase